MAHPGIWKPFRRRFWTRISTGDDIDNVWGGGWRKYPLSLVRSQYLLFYVFRGHSGVWKRQGEDDGRIGVQVSEARGAAHALSRASGRMGAGWTRSRVMAVSVARGRRVGVVVDVTRRAEGTRNGLRRGVLTWYASDAWRRCVGVVVGSAGFAAGARTC